MRFSLLGFPVQVHPTFWLMGLLLSGVGQEREHALARAASWILLVFVSVLVHELGHALLMRRFGRTPTIHLVGMGGETRWGDGEQISPGRRALVALAGPMAGFVFAIPFAALLFGGVAPRGSFVDEALRAGIWVNVGWGVLNLLPILPLDGGHVLEVLAHAALGPRGLRLARVVTIVLASAALAFAFYRAQIWIGLLAALAIRRAYVELRGEIAEPSIPAHRTPTIDDETRDAIARIWAELESGSADEASAIAERRLHALDAAPDADLARAALLEARAWVELDRGEESEARASAEQMPAGFSPSALLHARLLISRGRVAEGLDALDRVFLEEGGDRAAIVVAAAWLDAGQPERSVDLLRGLRGMQLGEQAHLVVATALFHAERLEHALEVCELAWTRFRAPVFAYDAACCHARLRRLDEGLRWLGVAIDAGYRDAEQLRSDPDLEGLRGSPGFEALLARIR